MADDRRRQLAERLRAARDYVGLSQEDAARAVNISRSAISLIESGERGVDALELAKFAEIYDRPLDYFTGTRVGGVPKEVELLARTASALSHKDREELARFAEFLKGRARKAGKK
jgi:transcriptional regulator with XRE-family HTH domain